MKSYIPTDAEIAALKQHLEYEPDTGIIRWKQPTRANTKAGDVAGGVNGSGYWMIKILGKTYKSHRIAFLFIHGFLPSEIDHINGDRSDNRIANLRAANRFTNTKNVAKYSNNVSGYKGVYLHKGTGKYHAQITVNKRKMHLGLFPAPEDAYEAYKQAARLHHGEFARF